MDDALGIILKKKELAKISKDCAIKEIKRQISPKIKKIILEKRFKSGDFKEFSKKIRAQLRRQTGAFNNPKIDREILIEKKDYGSLLLSHKSSKERMPYYEKAYGIIFERFPLAKSIIDLGCGLNPLSIEFMPKIPEKYLALEIDTGMVDAINGYFSQKKINGIAKEFDASDLKSYDFDGSFDLCFAFKLFEILEKTKSHRLTEDIILKIPAKAIIASFSTRTLGNAPMSKKRRVWFEVMSKRLGFSIEYFEIPNELFYILKRQ